MGCNWSAGAKYIFGIEADFQGFSGNDQTDAVGVNEGGVFTNDSGLTVAEVSKNLQFLGTLRARLGYAYTLAFMIYGTGGLAYGRVKVETELTSSEINGANVNGVLKSVGTISDSFTVGRVGWTLGAGAEILLGTKWSFKGEYLYYDLGTLSGTARVNGFDVGGGPLDWVYDARTEADVDVHLFRLGLNYHLN